MRKQIVFAAATCACTPEGLLSDAEYDAYIVRTQERFEHQLQHGALFTTDAVDLFEVFLKAMPPSERQLHVCNTCRQFFQRYGGLVVVDGSGATHSAVWDVADAPDYYKVAVAAVVAKVKKAKITGVFLSKTSCLGVLKTGQWHHWAVRLPRTKVGNFKRTQTAEQAMAEKLEDYRNIIRALRDYDSAILQEAVRVLETDALYRSEALLGSAKWLLALAEQEKRKSTKFTNIVWKAVASAPSGFCHPRSGMLGTLLDDIRSGFSFAEVKHRFDIKMHPLKYQRPVAPPKAGTITNAETIFAQLGLASALKRRLANINEIVPTWKPKPARKTPARTGVFASVTTATSAPTRPQVSIPTIRMTWAKFVATVLPTATNLEYYAANENRAYVQLVTAVDSFAPPIIRWDLDSNRNPVSWYVYHGGSTPTAFGLELNRWIPVSAITKQPDLWTLPSSTLGDADFLILKGCVDKRASQTQLCLFPEILRSELHEVRSVIEAYSKKGRLSIGTGTPAAGYRMAKDSTGIRLRAQQHNAWQEYIIDRWD